MTMRDGLIVFEEQGEVHGVVEMLSLPELLR